MSFITKENISLIIIAVISLMLGILQYYTIEPIRTILLLILMVFIIILITYLDVTTPFSRLLPESLFGKRYIKYRYDSRNGTLHKGHIRNVAIRIKTIQSILDAFPEELGDGYVPVLREIGKNVGKSFVDDFKDILIHGNLDDEGDWRRRLDLWGEYDSTAGFGKFNVSHLNDEMNGYVRIGNPFLTYKRDEDNPKLCPFMEGYIAGVIEKLIGIHVEVTEDQCSLKPSHNHCKFKVVPS